MPRRRTRLFVALLLALAGVASAAPVAAGPPPPPPPENPLYVLKWGEFGGGDAHFSDPQGVAVAPDGRVYVADTDNDRIQRFSRVGRFELVWGSSGTGNSQFRDPGGVAVDTAGNVYVTEITNDRVQIFNANGIFQTAFGGPGAGNGLFNNPRGMAFAPNGDLYVADTDNDRIQRFTNAGTFISTIGIQGTGPLQFNDPEGVAVDSAGNLYVADTGNHRVQKISPAGMFLDEWGAIGTAPGFFNAPSGITATPDDRLWVADTGNHRVQVFETDGTFVGERGSSGMANGNFDLPQSIAASADDGRVFVADTDNQRIQKLGPQIFFDDVPPTAPFFQQISWIAAGGYAEGYSSTLPPTVPGLYYRPVSDITRQAMSAFMYRLAGSPPGPFTDPGFLDVPVTHPFYLEISWLAQTGITTGFGGSIFGPSRTITRQAMAAFMYRYRGSPSGTFPDPEFTDVDSGDPFYEPIAWAADEGVVNGFLDGSFRPRNAVTRQAMASFLFGLSELGVPVV